jgi:signal transduction histidine kinase/ActR/RegA family two-component response regulator
MANDMAAQGGSSAEGEALRRDLLAASEQFAATSEVLTALGRNTNDPDAVLGTIVENARRLCRAQVAQIFRVDGDVFRLGKAVGLTDEHAEYLTRHPMTVDRKSLAGRVGLGRKTEQIVDVLDDPDYGRYDLQRISGFRTVLGAPLLLDDEVVGVLIVQRSEVEAFDQRETAVLEAFSAQAAIAIRTLDLVKALEVRSVELARKVDQLQALADVGEAVSSSLDLDEVLLTIVMNAVRMSGADGGSIMQYLEHDHSFSVRTAHGTSDELIAKLRSIRIEIDSTLVGRAAREGRPLQVPDLSQVERDPHLQLMFDYGWRSVLVAPMLRQGQIVGALVIRRKTPHTFSESTTDLLETFASQSALAIYNAGLFRELEVKKDELQIASQHKSEFLASMSHELRTPLNAVIGFAEVLLERMFGDINARQEEYLRDIWSSGKHLLALLNEILDLSKVEAGRMELAASAFAVRDAVEYVMSMVRERAALHGITLELDLGADVGVIYADEMRFKQVMLNLVSNAVKFSPDSGHVRVSATIDDALVVVTVSDDGPGIAADDRERIFESFQQGGRGAPTDEGTGLGLTLSRRIVELFGGRMWLDSDVGRGSIFGFSVPLIRPDEPESGAAGLGEQPRVVIIEDDRASLDLFSAYLEGTGIDLVKARDGSDGLALVREHAPAAVVLDIRLPGLDGWELLSTLKADAATAGIPVIVVTIVDDRSQGLAMGASEYLMKPVARDQLLGALSRVGLSLGGEGLSRSRETL